MWFVTSGGVTVVDPDRIGPPPVMPPVRVESVTADAQKFDPQSGLFGPSRTSHLHITFTALTLTDPTRIRFRYRSTGSTTIGSIRRQPRGALLRTCLRASTGSSSRPPTATVSGLPARPGTSGSSRCSTRPGGSTWPSRRRWRSSWPALWRLRVQRVRRQFALVLAERIRMSRAIHDTLLQGWRAWRCRWTTLSHTFDGTEPAGAQPRPEDPQAGRGIHPRGAAVDLGPAFAAPGRLRSAAGVEGSGERAIDGKPVQFDFVVKGTPHRCLPVVEEQLLHIGQEAMNNAVQHGGATRVGVEIAYDDEHTRLQVSDDGCGFDPPADGRLRRPLRPDQHAGARRAGEGTRS
jgi:hypothetical protein